MNTYIYSGVLHINGEDIPAMWTAGFSTIWVDDKPYNGYRDLVKRIHNK